MPSESNDERITILTQGASAEIKELCCQILQLPKGKTRSI